MSAADLIGQMVGKHRIERLLGEGGMGQVYLAVHPALGKTAAIKVLGLEYARRSEVVTRFFNEARTAASLSHANIVEVYDFDRLSDGRPYILMEYLEGETLSRLLKRERCLSPEVAFSYLGPVCAALGAAHRRGIIHRDVKPDNIFIINREGARGQVKVLDFGVARLVDESGISTQQTRAGTVLGTPEYMSPEQALGMNDRIGPPSDIYSLGVIAHRMLSGRVPFDGDNLSFGEIVIKHAQVPPPPLRALKPDIPIGLEQVVLKALAKRPEDRWPTMEAFAQAFAQATAPPQRAQMATFIADMPQSLPAPAPTAAPAVFLEAAASMGGTTERRTGTEEGPTRGRRKKALAIGLTTLAVAVAGGITVAIVLAGKHRARAGSDVAPAAVTVTAAPRAQQATTAPGTGNMASLAPASQKATTVPVAIAGGAAVATPPPRPTAGTLPGAPSSPIARPSNGRLATSTREVGSHRSARPLPAAGLLDDSSAFPPAPAPKAPAPSEDLDSPLPP